MTALFPRKPSGHLSKRKRLTSSVTSLYLWENSLNLPVAYEDPRLKIIVPEAINGGYQGVRTGEGPLPDNATGGDNYSLGNGGYYTSAPAPTYMMTFSEVKYIEAEARFRKGDKPGAYAALKTGILWRLQLISLKWMQK